MKDRLICFAAYCTLLLAIAGVSLVFFSAKRKTVDGVARTATPNTVVRFFYQPPYSYRHPPLIFRVVPTNDKRLGTAPIANLGGRTPYISVDDMQSLISALRNTRIAWHQSLESKPVVPVPNSEISEHMEISVFNSDRPAEGYVTSKDLCAMLQKLDKAFSQPRVLWEFQLFRVEYGCEVRDFDRNAYSQHDSDS